MEGSSYEPSSRQEEAETNTTTIAARVLIVLAIAIALGTSAAGGEEEAEAAPRELAGLAAFRLESHLGQNSLLLAEAIPAESYGWRPAEGVRSVGEMFTYVASSYYWFGVQLGAEKPSDVPDWDQIQSKEEIVNALSRSLEFLRQTLQGLFEKDLDQEIDSFGRQTTRCELVLNAMTHGSEHLGQAIAYARSLGVVPPWSDG